MPISGGKMADSINKEVFEHLVELAALELVPEEAEYLRRELNNQLKAIHELEAIPLDSDIKVTLHGIAYTPAISAPIRNDELSSYPHSDDILKQVPEAEGGYIIVPEIPEEELE
jgi:aspartyl-tRNA(Asn)/glutamyl-tRNA(Gln) amidotransferase subunit C